LGAFDFVCSTVLAGSTWPGIYLSRMVTVLH